MTLTNSSRVTRRSELWGEALLSADAEVVSADWASARLLVARERTQRTASPPDHNDAGRMEGLSGRCYG